jgi:hypothetical protein
VAMFGFRFIRGPARDFNRKHVRQPRRSFSRSTTGWERGT